MKVKDIIKKLQRLPDQDLELGCSEDDLFDDLFFDTVYVMFRSKDNGLYDGEGIKAIYRDYPDYEFMPVYIVDRNFT